MGFKRPVFRGAGRTSALPGLSVLREHRFGVVVGERILKPRLDDRLGGLRRVAGGLHAHAGLPQAEVAQDALDERHDAHLVLAVGAQERVGFPDF